MTIDVTDKQVEEMGKLAILASKPMGLGFLRHNPNLTKEEMTNIIVKDGMLYIDYYMGRMVKFMGQKVIGGWQFNEEISADYQSWITTYDSYQTLANVVKETIK